MNSTTIFLAFGLCLAAISTPVLGRKCEDLEVGWSGMWWTEKGDDASKFLGKTTQEDACKKMCADKDIGGVCGFKKSVGECYFCTGALKCWLTEYYDRYGDIDTNHLASNCH